MCMLYDDGGSDDGGGSSFWINFFSPSVKTTHIGGIPTIPPIAINGQYFVSCEPFKLRRFIHNVCNFLCTQVRTDARMYASVPVLSCM